MLKECPLCHAPITEKQLETATNRGMVHCNRCPTQFIIAQHTPEPETEEAINESNDSSPPKDQSPPNDSQKTPSIKKKAKKGDGKK